MICHHIFNKGNMTGTISVAETACPSGASEFTPDFSGPYWLIFIFLCRDFWAFL